MQRVVIADDRPTWVKREDRMMACMSRCNLYRFCSSRIGSDCKRLGGLEIPKLQK